ncbi:MAG: FlgO family outer membrane protein [bacterium]|nr:FlgO family outer membrane protein [bacterium]
MFKRTETLIGLVVMMFLVGLVATEVSAWGRKKEEKVVSSGIVEPTATTDTSAGDMDARIDELVGQISNSMIQEKKTKIAVIEFTDLQGNVTNFGRYLAEELITKLFQTGKFRVIERQLLNKVVEEQKLTLTQLIDPESAKQLGRILGVDAIVSGTITDLVDKLKVNARIIGTETGDVFAVASAAITKDETVVRLMETTEARPTVAGTKAQTTTYTKPKSTIGEEVVIFKEDFSEYEEGDCPTDWGDNVYVQTLKDGRKYLVSSLPGRHTVGQNVDLPKNFYLQFDFNVSAKHSLQDIYKYYEPDPHSTISLVDAKDMKYSIDWELYGNHFTLPDGTRNSSEIEGDKTLRLNVTDNVIKIYVDGKFVISGVMKGFDKFVRFEVDVLHTPYFHYGDLRGYCNVHLTNFIIERKP